MSTPDPLDALAAAALGAGPAGLAGLGGAGSGLPEIDVVARLANELFRSHALRTRPGGAWLPAEPFGAAQPASYLKAAVPHTPAEANYASYSPERQLQGLGAPSAPSAFSNAGDLGGLDKLAGEAMNAVNLSDSFAGPGAFAAPSSFGSFGSVPSPSSFGAPTSFGAPAAFGAPTSFGAPSTRGIFDVNAIRAQFPILNERLPEVGGRQLVWLDNAATTQKPQVVIERLAHFYTHENSNIHRAAHSLAARSTDAYENARKSVARFLGAQSPSEIVFVRGATEGINLVAQGWGRRHLQAGDEILITHLEHHSNIVPWQHIAAERGARLRVVPLDGVGQVRLDAFERLLGPRTRIVALSHVSNALGTILPIAEMVKSAHHYGARVLVDGAQAVSHMPVDVQALDCDYYVFSGHKVFGPTGIGAVYGKPAALEEIGPWQGGGNMIADVTFDRTTYADVPARFEAGTGNIADAVGLGVALDWLQAIGLHNVERYEHELLRYGTAALRDIPGLKLIGTAPEKAGVLSLVIDGLRVDEIGRFLASQGIAVRAGHHCAQPALRHFGLEQTVRPSLALYNNYADIDALVSALQQLRTAAR